MYTFCFSSEKNSILKLKREISFEAAIYSIKEGKILDIIEHPNQEKYTGQKMYILEINNYAYVVPFVKDNEKKEIFLKTVFSSRKLTAIYLNQEKDNDK